MELMNHIHLEVFLAAGYVLFLLLVSFGIEMVARYSYQRSHNFRTGGFRFHHHLEAYECPEGQFLWLKSVDHNQRLARYRGKPGICNHCAAKIACTDSNDGREVVRSLVSWPASEIGRFHRGISLTLVLLAVFILSVELFRHHAPSELFVLGAGFMLVLVIGLRLLAAFRANSLGHRFRGAELEVT